MKQFSELIDEKLKLNNNSKLNITQKTFNINDIKLNTPYKCFTVSLNKINKLYFDDLGYNLICVEKPFKNLDDKYATYAYWETDSMKIDNKFKLYGSPSLNYKFLVLFYSAYDESDNCAFILFENLNEAIEFKKEYTKNTRYQNEIKQLYDNYLKI